MAFKNPTFVQLLNRAATTFNATLQPKIKQINAFATHSILNVFCKILAVFHLDLYQRIDAEVQDFFVSTASLAGLLKRGADEGVPRKMAEYARGCMIISGTPGASVESGREVRSDTGLIYIVQDDGVIPNSGELTIQIKAKNTGAAQNLPPHSTLTPVSPWIGIASECTVDANGIIGGAEIESTEEYRARLLKFIQDQPGAGDPAFYEHLALSRPGVTRAKCIRTIHGPGTVGLVFMMDGAYDDGLPRPGDIKAMQDFLAGTAPADVNEIYVRAPDLISVPIQICDLVNDTPAVRAGIHDVLASYFLSLTFGDTMHISQIEGLIAGVPGELSHTLLSPNSDITIADYEILALGGIEYTQTQNNDA